MIRKRLLFETIFGTSTKAGRRFDVILLWVILASVLVVVLDSVQSINLRLGRYLLILEWLFTVTFTVEYMVRIWVVPNRRKYIFSFWGLVDLVSFLPTYLSLIIAGYKYLVVLRIIRLVRVFQIYQLTQFLAESKALYGALKNSIFKILIFMVLILIIVVVMGAIMYVVEGETNGFTSIPQSIYWAIMTITTVGYGDIVPITVLGKFISSFIMLIGYSIIAVPTGIITFELSKKTSQEKHLICRKCEHLNPPIALFCNRCGSML